MANLNINELKLAGRVGGDPEIKMFGEKTGVANFSLATKYSYKDKDGNWVDKTDWHNIAAYNYDYVKKYVKKGTLVYFSGSMSVDKYTNKDGENRVAYRAKGRISVVSDGIDVKAAQTAQTDQSLPPEEISGANDLPF